MSEERIKALIGIHDHVINCIIGELPEEREFEQSILVDVEIEADVSQVIVSDRIEDTINYVEIAQACTTLAVERRYHLLETFVHEALDYILEHWPVVRVRIKVKKPHALSTASYAYVEMDRRKKQ